MQSPEELQSKKQPASYLSSVRATVESKPNDIFATWYDGKGNPTDEYSFQRMWDEAGHCAWLLRKKWDVNKGDRVVLCYDFGIHFFAIFLGCLRAGVTAVLVYPPGPPLVKSLQKMSKVIEDCSPALVLTQSKINFLRAADLANPASKSRSLWPRNITWQSTDIVRTTVGNAAEGRSNGLLSFLTTMTMAGTAKPSTAKTIDSFDEPNIEPSDIAFLQYTSGSTGDPKGVMVSHSALFANFTFLSDCWELGFTKYGKVPPQQCIGLSWLPQYHDMGLIQMGIGPLAAGWRMHMISPISFIRKPLLWMELMSTHRCHMSTAPDFAFQLVARKFREAKSQRPNKEPIAGLDLSCVHQMLDGAEPVRRDTMAAFSEAFCPYKLKEDWFATVYGMAEHVVGISWYHGCHLSKFRSEEKDKQQFVAVSHEKFKHPSIDIKIVNPDTCQEVPTNVTGEVWISGPSIAAGYFAKPELSDEVFRARLKLPQAPNNATAITGTEYSTRTYLRSGDLGFYQDGYLYICGRKKDVIIVNGVNYYPQDIEHAVQDASTAVRPGCVAAFSSNETGNDGQLEIVFEIRPDQVKNASQICQQVKMHVMQHIGLLPSRIVAIKERTIAKTTSGKIQRRRNRDLLHANQHSAIVDLMPANDGMKSAFNRSDTIDTTDGESDDTSYNGSNTTPRNDHVNFDDIVANIAGHVPPPDDTWDDIGLSSMAELELRNQISKSYNIMLAEDCCQLHRTPAALKAHVEASRGQQVPIKCDRLHQLHSRTLDPSIFVAIQFVGVVLLLLSFASPIIPAYEFATLLHSLESTDGRSLAWICYPLAVPIWMVGVTINTIFVKWLIIGRYKEGRTHAMSVYYIRWWFVDRMVHLWEQFVGTYILGTPLINLVYLFMGCSVHASSSIEAFIREFDIIALGEGAKVNHTIRCRVFGPMGDTRGASMRFRAIEIGKHSNVKGMVCPGASVGDEAVVERLAVVNEGGQVPAKVAVKGNPAFISCTDSEKTSAESTQRSTSKSENSNETDSSIPSRSDNCADITGNSVLENSSGGWQLGALKLLWLVFELYLVFGIFLALQSLLQHRLPVWRYSRLAHWVTLLGLAPVGILTSSMVLKWLLIGRKTPGPYHPGLYRDFADWAVDYHFNLGFQTVFMLTSNSRLWNAVLMAHGMDVDFVSKIHVKGCVPSKVDLITVKRSFISGFSFDVANTAIQTYQPVTIEDSSIGFSSVVDAGVTIKRSLVPPQSYVSTDLVRQEHDPRKAPTGMWYQAKLEICGFVLYSIILGLVAGSFIPVYEMWINVFKPQTSFEAVIVLMLNVVVQTMTWMVLLRMASFVAFGTPKTSLSTGAGAADHNPTQHGNQESSMPMWRVSMSLVCQSLTFAIQTTWFAVLLWGTPMMKYALQAMGSTVEGRLLYLGNRIYEFQYVTFADGAVVDESHAAGHYVVFSSMKLGPSRVAGVLHPDCYVMGNTDVVDEENGPCKVILNRSA